MIIVIIIQFNIIYVNVECRDYVDLIDERSQSVLKKNFGYDKISVL